MGKIAQINATRLHGRIAPKAKTVKMPKLNAIVVIVMIVPRIEGSL